MTQKARHPGYRTLVGIQNMNNYTIRFANPTDAEQIARCHIASWQKSYRGLFTDEVLATLSVPERTQRWFGILNANVKVLVLEDNNRILGFVSLCASRDTDTDPKKCGEIHAIYLHPDAWYQGLGKNLCQQALAELLAMGFSEVMLWVLKENEQARKFYQRMGFTETGHTKQECDYNVSFTLLRCIRALIP